MWMNRAHPTIRIAESKQKTLRHYIARDHYHNEMFQNYTIPEGHVFPDHIGKADGSPYLNVVLTVPKSTVQRRCANTLCVNQT